MSCSNQKRIDDTEVAEFFKEAEWPPKVQLEEGEEPVKLTEFDISWVFCTVLGMKWDDAQTLTNETERKFLYNKAMVLTENLVAQRVQMEEEKKALNAQLQEKIDNLNLPNPPEAPESPLDTNGPSDQPPQGLGLNL